MWEPDLLDLVERVAAAADRSGMREAALELRERTRSTAAAEPTLAVVGRAGAGKSALINALLERPGLLPVAPGGARTPYVAVRARDGGESARLLVDGGRTGITLPVDGFAAALNNETRRVAGAELTVRSPSLRGLAILDTPALGDPDSGTRQLTLAVLARADALLHVIDAGAPLGRSDLDLLVSAAERLAVVIVALTKIDAHRGWQRIRDDDRALLDAAGSSLASVPVLPVSARLAELAWASRATDPEEAASLAHESGLDELRAVVDDQVIAAARRLRAQNLLRRSANALARVAAREEADAARPGTEGEAKEAKARIERALADLDASRASWPDRVASGLRDLDATLDVSIEDGLAQLRARYGEALAAPGVPEPARVREDLDAALRALVLRLDTQRDEGVMAIFATLERALDMDAPDPRITDLPPLPRVGGPKAAAPPASGDLPVQFHTFLRSTGFGSQLGGFAGTFLGLLLGPAAAPFGAVAGFLLGGWSDSVQRRLEQAGRTRDALSELVAEALDGGTRTLRERLERSSASTREALVSAGTEAIDRRERDLRAELASAERSMEAGRAAWEEAAAEAARRLESIRGLQAEVAAMARSVGGGA